MLGPHESPTDLDYLFQFETIEELEEELLGNAKIVEQKLNDNFPSFAFGLIETSQELAFFYIVHETGYEFETYLNPYLFL